MSIKKTGYTLTGVSLASTLILLFLWYTTGFSKTHILFYTIAMVLFCVGIFLTMVREPLTTRKKQANVLLAIAICLIGLGVMTPKALYNNLANILVVFGVFFLAFTYLPLHTSNRIQKWKEYTDKMWLCFFLSVGDLFGLAAIVLGTLFKLMHWPWANNLLFFGVITLATLFVFWNRLLSQQLVRRKHAEDKTKETLVRLKEKSKEVEDSILYAKHLQEAILPPKELIGKHASDSFVLYKPKDIVAGDFFWAYETGDLFFVAAADSTGHGVPGAMVSVVCSNALDRSVKEFGLKEPGKILDKTRELVSETFKTSGREVRDGMDISLLCIDQQNQRILWAGANNPLWYSDNGELKEIKASKQAVGRTEDPVAFRTHYLDYHPDAIFYLFTDGLADQFGGPKGKKFKYRQFEELLIKIGGRTMKEQCEIIDQTIESWRGTHEQVDDICVLGIRI